MSVPLLGSHAHTLAHANASNKFGAPIILITGMVMSYSVDR